MATVVDSAGTVVHRDYIIGQEIISDGQNFELTTNPITEEVTLRILYAQGTAQFDTAFARLAVGRGTVLPNGYSGNGPFSLVPRNAALRIEFSQAIDPATVDGTTLQVFAGVPPATPLSVRYIIDQSDPRVLIVDPTVTLIDQVALGIPVNATGFPASVGVANPNITLRIPTQLDPVNGQTKILRSSGGSPVARLGNGPTDPSDPTRIVRVFRSGNNADQNRGFLLDLTAPRLLGEQPIVITGQTPTQLVYEFDVASCITVPAVGDIIQQGTRFAEVVQVVDDVPPDFVVNIRRLDGSGGSFSQVQRAQYVSPYDEGVDAIECFFRFTPFAVTPPNSGIDPTAMVTLRFSEPMDPTTVSPFDSMILSRQSQLSQLTFRDFVIGAVNPSADNREFTFAPANPGMAHERFTQEDYTLHLVTDVNNPNSMRDLAGNGLDFPDKSVSFSLDPNADTVRVDALALRYNSQNEDSTAGDEWRGQFKVFGDGTIEGRDANRFGIIVDQNQPVLGLMLTFTLPIQTPLVPLGSRMMTVWRYIDMGFTYDDQTGYNIDVERLAWAPFGGQVVSDFFDQIEIHLSHSQYLPDEYIDSGSQLPRYPNSGLSRVSFSANVLRDSSQLKVYDGEYRINPLDAFIVPGSGLVLMNYPEFEDDFGEKITYTWRDTSIETLAAPNGVGADPMIVSMLPGATRHDYARGNAVPTIGLPLLMDYHVHPATSGQTIGLNGFQISVASVTSSKPNFRVFSSGGYNSQNAAVTVDPNNNTPRGGFNPISSPPGLPTPPDDPVVYWGKCDFVIRISRGITRWFDSSVNDPTRTYPIYQPPVIEPLQSNQPAGTSLIVDFRGADNVSGSHLLDATCVSLYGEPISTQIQPTCNSPAASGKTNWSRSISDADGKRFLQMRFTLVNNIATGGVPTLSTTGIGWLKIP